MATRPICGGSLPSRAQIAACAAWRSYRRGTYAVGTTGGSSTTTQVGDVEAGPQATVSTSALPPYYALCYIMKT